MPPRSRVAFLVAVATVASFLALSSARPARAETRDYAFAPEAFKLANVGPVVFATRNKSVATASGTATCLASFTGSQTPVASVSIPVILQVDVRAGTTVLASKKGVGAVSVGAPVTANTDVSCWVLLVPPYTTKANAEGTITASVPVEVQPPVVTQTYVLGATSTTNVARREADYAPRGAFVSMDGKYLRGAKATIAGIAAQGPPPIYDDSFALYVPANAPIGPTQLVVDNGLARTTLPFFVGTPAPSITAAQLKSGELNIAGKYLDPVTPEVPPKPVVKVGGVAFNVRMCSSSFLSVDVPDGTRGVITVDTVGGRATGPVLRDETAPAVATLVIDPASLDWQGGVVRVVARASDNVGVTSVMVRVTKPDGTIVGLPLKLSSGDAKLGDWTATFTQPMNLGTTALTYQFEASAVDADANIGRRAGGALTVAPKPRVPLPLRPQRPSM